MCETGHLIFIDSSNDIRICEHKPSGDYKLIGNIGNIIEIFDPNED